MDPKDRLPSTENEGEGSRSADIDYRKRQAEFEKAHAKDAEKLAEDAARDVRENRGEFRRAEEIGKSRSKVDGHEE